LLLGRIKTWSLCWNALSVGSTNSRMFCWNVGWRFDLTADFANYNSISNHLLWWSHERIDHWINH
jgi:hypothetical protein